MKKFQTKAKKSWKVSFIWEVESNIGIYEVWTPVYLPTGCELHVANVSS